VIPAIICPCINRFDLLERMIRSIDHPVGKVVVIDNSCENWEPPDGLDVEVKVIRPIINIGYGGGINAGISQTPDLPWWIFMNADVRFGPGDLAKIEAAMDGHDEPRFVCSSTVNPYAMGVLNRAVIEKVGLFDEWTFFPAYFEDNDYEQRFIRHGLERTLIDLNLEHGEHGPGIEMGSRTIHSESKYLQANQSSFPENSYRYRDKWGGFPGHETFATPWDKPVPLSHVDIDLAGRARRSWS
jgi:glycosyltransferase involved in cell wall biosynthesis